MPRTSKASLVSAESVGNSAQSVTAATVANSQPEFTDVLKFMMVRAPDSVDTKTMRRRYIQDDYIGTWNDKAARLDTDLQSSASSSAIGKLVYERVFCGPDFGNDIENLQELIKAVLGLIPPYSPNCGNDPPKGANPGTALHASPLPLVLPELERHSYVTDQNYYYLLPDRLEQFAAAALVPNVLRALDICEDAREKFDLAKLIKRLELVFGNKPLYAIVFDKTQYAHDFGQMKRVLFDTLYLLYILRRRVSINLEHIIQGLRTLHVLEALAIDSFIARAKRPSQLSAADSALLSTLKDLFPVLEGWDRKSPIEGLPLIRTAADFLDYFTAEPVVHPIFARLFRYKRPFNVLKPLGIGDLKVVKQKLCAYLPGEISHIDNVMKGEIKDRTHRRLEKTEEVFSLSSEHDEETQKDTQSTDRFELKREVENVLKSDLAVTANASFQYQQKPILVNVSGGLSYTRSSNDQSKTTSAFSQEVIGKAVSKVQRRTAQQRALTKLFESEETNKHGFDNVKGQGHVSGIYRWIDKHYNAQLFNYGKRMMYEFIVPEPAAFFVESRLHAFEAALDCPQRPSPPAYKTVALNFSPASITKAKFDELRGRYDLSGFTYPVESKRAALEDLSSNQNYFTGTGRDGKWDAKTYQCKLVDAKGYEIKEVLLEGLIIFHDKGEKDSNRQNIMAIKINGYDLPKIEDPLINVAQQGVSIPITTPVLLFGDNVSLNLGFWDMAEYSLTFSIVLSLTDQARLDWKMQVYNKVRAIEEQRVEDENRELAVAYNSQMADYRRGLTELKTKATNELLQGQSEAFNREIIRAELKKHCLAMLTLEFDSDTTDDVLTDKESVKSKLVEFRFPKLTVSEESNPTSCTFVTQHKTVDYASIDLVRTREKGRFIQFLEQAFEWQQLAYIFYPYFWATPPKWIELMNRSDDADPNYSAFLQAGAAKVLVAVTPAYDAAVLHFLATREPWEGGPAPVIGDPLFIPLHEELRKSQDDLYNAVPEGKPWSFTMPTSLVYLQDSGTALPEYPCD